MKDLEERRSHYEPSLGPTPDDSDHLFALEENDFVPHFQRVSISGEYTVGVSATALSAADLPGPWRRRKPDKGRIKS